MIAPRVTRTFRYRAVGADGRRERGTAVAAEVEAARRTLEARGLTVLELDPVAERGTLGPRDGGRLTRRRDVAELTRALASLLDAGVPLARALGIAASISRPRVAAVLDDVRARVAEGDALAAALARHPRWFSALYVGVVRAGERGGDLAGSIGTLAAQLEAEDRLRARLLSSSLYPLLLAAAGMAAVTVLVLFVLPRFAELLASTHSALPRSTALLLEVSAAARRWWIPGLGGLLALGGMAALYTRTPGGARMLATALVSLPVVGAIRRQVLAARCARLVAVLLHGGAPLLGALDDAAESLDDPLARDELRRVRARVREGEPVHSAIAAGTLFPALVPRLLAVGEEAGRLEDFFGRCATLCEDRAERALQRLVALAEPAMILGLGVIIGFVALALLQAIYGVNADVVR